MSNQELVQNLVKSGVLKSSQIIAAFLEIDRRDFVGEQNLVEAYGDYPLPIGKGQTISQPTTVVIMLELLQPKLGDKVLDVGSGSAWTTALLAKIVSGKGFVWATERVSELVEFGRNNLQKYLISNAKILPAGSQLGLVDKAPFDKILVSAAGRNLPAELVEQLKVGGRMVIPILDAVWKIDKISRDKIEQERYPGFVFVPLVH